MNLVYWHLTDPCIITHHLSADNPHSKNSQRTNELSAHKKSLLWAPICVMSTGFTLPSLGDIIHDKYQVTKRIGAGAFGAIFEVQSLENGKIYAIKLENLKTPSPQLQYEFKLYEILDAPIGIPRVYECWTDENYRAMIMDRLGYSLGHHFRRCGKILSLKTVVMCAIQMMCRLEYLHQRSLIHRDIKPDNFVFGVGTNSNLLYMIDLGLAKKYRNLTTLVHINYSEDKGLAGTARYVSINVHLGVEQSCRDDLESVGYVLISLVKGKLPWQGMEAGSKGEKYELLSQSKMDTPLESLCQGLPNEFLQYMQRVRALRFDERPAYTLLRGLFVNVMVKNNMAFDYRYDWVENRSKRLMGILSGTEDQTGIQIQTTPDELLGATKIHQGGAQNSFWQPLPFFAIVNEAAKFVGMSKKTGDCQHEEEEEQGNEFGKIPKRQSMFLLDPNHTRVPVGEQAMEFVSAN